jgi:YD repeat-containing protein
MTKTRTILAALAIAWAGIAAAQEGVDFSGTWVLNVKKGENLGMVAAIQETLVVAQSGEELKIDFTDVFQGNTTTRQVTYDLSGNPVENFAAMGDRSETVSKWVDADLVTTWTSEGAIAGTTVARTETRTLMEDGQVMTVATARGEQPAMVLVYEKQ